MGLLLQSARSRRELKTTSPGSSVSSADVPIQQCIQYQIAVIRQKALSTSVPPYIDELTPSDDAVSAVHRRSASLCAVVVAMWIDRGGQLRVKT